MSIRPSRSSRPKVLYVNAQLRNRTAFHASMRRYADIKTADAGEEAFALLQTEEFPIVISDQQMEGGAGTELLIQVRQMCPDAIRILLAAHADFSMVIDAINAGHISRFIRKPWDREEMRAILEDAHRQYWEAREHQELVAQFAQQARAAVVGKMTVGISEDLQTHANQLAAARGLLRSLQRQHPELATVLDGIDGIEKMAQTLLQHRALLETTTP
ncbi:MAG: response regulator [Myxococcota bacterium]